MVATDTAGSVLRVGKDRPACITMPALVSDCLGILADVTKTYYKPDDLPRVCARCKAPVDPVREHVCRVCWTPTYYGVGRRRFPTELPKRGRF